MQRHKRFGLATHVGGCGDASGGMEAPRERRHARLVRDCSTSAESGGRQRRGLGWCRTGRDDDGGHEEGEGRKDARVSEIQQLWIICTNLKQNLSKGGNEFCHDNVSFVLVWVLRKFEPCWLSAHFRPFATSC